MQQDVVGDQRGIGAQFAAPVAFFAVLDGEQIAPRSIDGRGYPALDVIDFAEAHFGRI